MANLAELPEPDMMRTAPTASILGPEVVLAGQPARFEASVSGNQDGHALGYQWFLNGLAGDRPILERAFERQGFYRLGLTVNNGALAGLAWRDILVIQPVARELGTEGQGSRWGFELEGNDDHKGRVLFQDDLGASSATSACGSRPIHIPETTPPPSTPPAATPVGTFTGNETDSLLDQGAESEYPRLPKCRPGWSGLSAGQGNWNLSR